MHGNAKQGKYIGEGVSNGIADAADSEMRTLRLTVPGGT